MPLQIQREGATPNMLKYSVTAGPEGGEIILSRDELLRDSVRGPLRSYIERGIKLDDASAACRYLLCNPSMRTVVTPRTFPRVAVDAAIDDAKSAALKIMAEPGATAIVAL